MVRTQVTKHVSKEEWFASFGHYANQLRMDVQAAYDASLSEPEKGMLEEVRGVFESISGLLDASMKPLPREHGDGSYAEEKAPTSILSDLANTNFKDFLTIGEIVKGKLSSEPTNDRDYLMEKIVKVIPHASKLLTLLMLISGIRRLQITLRILGQARSSRMASSKHSGMTCSTLHYRK